MVMQAPQTRTQLTLSLLLCCGFAVTLSGCSGCQPAKPLQIGPGPNDSPPQVTEQPAEEETDWETEAFASAVGEQLHRIRDALQQADAMDASQLAEVALPTATIGQLRPQQMTVAFADPLLKVERGEVADDAQQTGPNGLQIALQQLAKPLAGRTDIHVKFKVISVLAGDDTVATDVVYQASGRGTSDTVQQSAIWSCVWQNGHSEDDVPRLLSVRSRDFEEVLGTGPEATLFADCTESVFRNEPDFRDQFMRGIDYWRTGIQSQYGVYPYGHHGITVGDINGDGLDDIYVCQPAGLPNRLYLQNQDGSVTEAAASMGVDWLDRSRGALLVDLDNDQDQDLVLALNEMVVIMSHEGDRYVERSVFRPTGDPGSLAAADYDLDGDLDIYVVDYGERFLSDNESSGPVPYHDANNGGENVLLRNDGDCQFVDVTSRVGLDQNNRRWSFAASWEDYDSDGDPDLYVANDFGRNNLYRNDGGKFTDVAAQAGVEDIAAGMSVSWGDYNQDGKMDLYVGNMFSSAGLRIAFQDRFQPLAGADVRQEFQRHARGNSLFENVGDGTFRDVSETAAVTLGRWAWSSNFVDINNDGREDLLVANGFVTGSDTDDL